MRNGWWISHEAVETDLYVCDARATFLQSPFANTNQQRLEKVDKLTISGDLHKAFA